MTPTPPTPGRPPLPPGTRVADLPRLTLRLNPEVMDALDKASKAQGKARWLIANEIIGRALLPTEATLTLAPAEMKEVTAALQDRREGLTDIRSRSGCAWTDRHEVQLEAVAALISRLIHGRA